MQIQLLKFIQYLSAGALVLITFNTSIKVFGAEWMIEQFAGGNRNQVVNLISMFIFGFLFGVSKIAQLTKEAELKGRSLRKSTYF